MVDVPAIVQELIDDHHVRKTCRIKFLDGSYADIVNENILANAMTFTEQFNTNEDIVFGQLESNVFEVSVKDCPSVKGKRIEVFLEVDVTDVQRIYTGQISSDVPYPFYRIPVGRFTVTECKRGVHGETKVTALSHELNTGIYPLSGYEWNKLLYYQSRNAQLSFNPVFFALDNVSSVVGIDTADFPDLSSHKETLTDAPLLDIFVSPIETPQGERHRVTLTYNRKKVTVSTAQNKLLVYGHGDFVNKYDDVYNEISHVIDTYIQLGVYVPTSVTDPNPPGNNLYPMINTSGLVGYNLNTATGTGFADIKYPAVSTAEISISYEVNIKAENTDTQEVYLDETYQLFDPDSVFIATYTAGQYGELYFPDVAHTIERQEEITAFIEPDTSDLPNPVDVVRAWMEANGIMLKERRDGYYEFAKMVLMPNTLYPNDNVYPDDDLYFDGGGEAVIRPNSIKINSAEYEMERMTPYTNSSAQYTDTNQKVRYVNASTSFPITDPYLDLPFKNKDFSQNLLFKEYVHSKSTAQALIENFLANVRDIFYYKGEVSTDGHPYIEAGDTIDVITPTGMHETIVMQRVMRGVQVLNDDLISD